MVRLPAAIVALFLSVAPALAASASPAPPASRVTCESIIEPVGSYSWRPKRVVLGVAAVPPAYLPQTFASGTTRWPYWSKAGLVIRADSPPARLAVPPRWRNRVAITWGDAGPASLLRIDACPPSSSLGAWNAYSGGFLLRSRAACVPITFTVGGRSATVRFGVGKRCG
jgi:hypothetical protein